VSEWYTEDVQKALEIIGGVEWERDSTYTERICHRYGKWVVQRRPVGSEDWETLGFGVTYICHALIEKALREWLEARRVFVHFGTPGDVWFIANQPPFFINSVLMGDGTWALECTDQSNHMKPDGYLAALAAAALAAEKEATP